MPGFPAIRPGAVMIPPDAYAAGPGGADRRPSKKMALVMVALIRHQRKKQAVVPAPFPRLLCEMVAAMAPVG